MGQKYNRRKIFPNLMKLSTNLQSSVNPRQYKYKEKLPRYIIVRLPKNTKIKIKRKIWKQPEKNNALHMGQQPYGGDQLLVRNWREDNGMTASKCLKSPSPNSLSFHFSLCSSFSNLHLNYWSLSIWLSKSENWESF